MGKKRGEKLKMIFGMANVKRCFLAALLSVAVFPVLLALSLADQTFGKNYMMPMAFFSIGSAAFAYLLHQVAKNKMKQYYDAVTWIYLTAVHLFFVYMAQESMLFYYVAVVLAAYVVLMPLDRYVIMALGELVCFAAVSLKNGSGVLTTAQMVTLIGIHLFAFVLSRDFYATKKGYLVEERKLRREVQEAEHDPLTGLMNRRGLERHVAELWTSCVRRQETVAAFVMDIDLFKSYNDRFGHVQGDVCISRVAASIAETVRGYGIASRIGGEEFLVFVHGKSAPEMYELAERIRENVEGMHISRGTGNAVVTISIGLDIRYAGEDVTLQGLYGRADKALYQAKQEGRNCVRGSMGVRGRRTRIG